MSSELERLLREAGRRLPGPDADATRRARGRALAAVRRRRRLTRPAAMLLAAVLVGLGVGIGALVTPSGTEARQPYGLGFLPAHGWSVLQNGGDGTPVRPAVAVAANVPLSPDDDPDGLPLSTLQSLPPGGIVIIAGFTARGEQPWHDQGFPRRSLPLRASDATRGIEFATQLRQGRPLGQYQLRAGVNRHNVDVNMYFGIERPTAELFAVAQRQLDRLIVRTALPAPRGAGSSEATVVDRTFVCTPAYGRVNVVASPRGSGASDLYVVDSAGYVRVSSGPGSFAADLVAAARPGMRSWVKRFPGAVYASSRRCTSVSASVPLSRAGLPGPALEWWTRWRCRVRGRVLIRVRAVVEATSSWGPIPGTSYTGTRGTLREASMVVRDEVSRRPLAFVELDRAGKTSTWTSTGANCTR
ncbi:MAG: hypothetical protein WD689_02730 [Gaiellaceae bacterium]